MCAREEWACGTKAAGQQREDAKTAACLMARPELGGAQLVASEWGIQPRLRGGQWNGFGPRARKRQEGTKKEKREQLGGARLVDEGEMGPKGGRRTRGRRGEGEACHLVGSSSSGGALLLAATVHKVDSKAGIFLLILCSVLMSTATVEAGSLAEHAEEQLEGK